MNKKITLFLVVAIPLFCMAQKPAHREYYYDESGNRVLRVVINIGNAPPSPEDSLQVTSYELQVTSDEYFVEKVAQVEMKIYPNPTTEIITLEISNFEKLQTGVFKLYNLNGQLLKECPVHSVSTEVSLAGLASGTYLLKVFMNDKTEDWKIIKQ